MDTSENVYLISIRKIEAQKPPPPPRIYYDPQILKFPPKIKEREVNLSVLSKVFLFSLIFFTICMQMTVTFAPIASNQIGIIYHQQFTVDDKQCIGQTLANETCIGPFPGDYAIYGSIGGTYYSWNDYSSSMQYNQFTLFGAIGWFFSLTIIVTFVSLILMIILFKTKNYPLFTGYAIITTLAFIGMLLSTTLVFNLPDAISKDTGYGCDQRAVSLNSVTCFLSGGILCSVVSSTGSAWIIMWISTCVLFLKLMTILCIWFGMK